LRSLYCSSDSVRSRGAAVTYLSHNASFHSKEQIAPSNRGIKHIAMLVTAQNDDELAFVLGHESAHHVQGHLQQKRQNSLAGALILGGLSTLAGAAPDVIRNAQDYGMILGQRSYSKTYE
jgi:hypothetical protein